MPSAAKKSLVRKMYELNNMVEFLNLTYKHSQKCLYKCVSSKCGYYLNYIYKQQCSKLEYEIDYVEIIHKLFP